MSRTAARLARRLRELVRQFPENGMKLRLENPRNVRDALDLRAVEGRDLIDWGRLILDRTTYIQRDYRHVEADVIFRAPLRGRSRRRLLIYILLEHQSEPDVLMLLRLVDYVTQIYKAQVRAWERRHGSLADFRLDPVLPVVFYTGSRPWEQLDELASLVDARIRPLFATRLPVLAPVFLNLGDLSAEQLESEGGFFGWVLRLVQQRQAGLREFRALLERVVQHLETMPPRERTRWLEFLSYIHALVYYGREVSEHGGLHQTIADSVQLEERRQEVTAMFRTMADVHLAQGRKEGRRAEAVRSRRDTLLRQLRVRFGELPDDVVERIEHTSDVPLLDTWLERIITAKKLANMGITASS